MMAIWGWELGIAADKANFLSAAEILILRSAHSARLEGWPRVHSLPPSFETLAAQAPQDEVITSFYSLIPAKCAATASGVQSDGAKLIPSVSRILITAKEPAPAPMMVRVGASSASRYSTAGVIASGFISASACGGSSSSVMRVAAVGEIVLTRMLRSCCRRR